MAKKQSAGSDRQAKIQAAAKASGGGANKIVVAAVIAIVAIVGVVGWVVFRQVSAQNAIKGDGNAVPAGTTMGEGYRVFPEVTTKPGAPAVDLYEDFQCPSCGQIEALLGSTITDAAKAGDIKLTYHVLNFLDGKLGNDGSIKAANGAFCAADAGKFDEYHNAAYAKQPAEGTGYSTDLLKSLASTAGLTGTELATWTQCVELGKYTNYVKAVNDKAFAKDGIQGTPTFKFNGTEVATAELASPEKFKAYVTKMTKP